MSWTPPVVKRALFVVCLSFLILASVGTTTASATSHPSAYKTGTVDAGAEQDFLNRTNALRASLGLGQLHLNNELLVKARNWSETQAEAGTIFHSTLTDGVTQNWHRLGENVGMGPDVASIHDALVRSPRHYENLTDPGFTEVGIGVVRQGNVMYVTEEFMELMPTSSSGTQNTSSPTTPKTTVTSAPTHNASAGHASSQGTPVTAETAPLATASPDLSAVIEKLSALET